MHQLQPLFHLLELGLAGVAQSTRPQCSIITAGSISVLARCKLDTLQLVFLHVMDFCEDDLPCKPQLRSWCCQAFVSVAYSHCLLNAHVPPGPPSPHATEQLLLQPVTTRHRTLSQNGLHAGGSRQVDKNVGPYINIATLFSDCSDQHVTVRDKTSTT
jgi:hypothetical protein